jgi:hypothetical protein
MQYPKVYIKGHDKSVDAAINIINRFAKKNEIPIRNFKIMLDYNCRFKLLGYANPFLKEITVNPSVCYSSGMITKGSFGFFEDLSTTGVIIHEFCHYVVAVGNLKKFYFKAVPEGAYININSLTNKNEEITEVLYMFIVNPWFLKCVFPKSYEFFKSKLKTVFPCTSKGFKFIFDRWCFEFQGKFKRRFKKYLDLLITK